ncbi:hypothetical protein CAOG_07441 [Capsaspora owczarzaki ATCC 30864]|uniref:hypothetical protein n=1 Tax=Capsaspora owczarzaki (strain ATCC 30864) TaxID=595528 RepID=UPI0001FE283A|nr:hypothetical protein CAOG_07441 [Capsaspora owczarzaki ATCC 30864]|eukprot:XP_004343300.1 hypothetical protein CAOG_07441 [Capsaspora owczarzaki ATCC 30864]
MSGAAGPSSAGPGSPSGSVAPIASTSMSSTGSTPSGSSNAGTAAAAAVGATAANPNAAGLLAIQSQFASLSHDELVSRLANLMQQFAKANSANAVLKKVVLTEQANVAALSDELHSKDQSTRKLIEDVDTLTFHNAHLTKKVEVLQAELEAPAGRERSNSKNATPHTLQSLHVTEEELSSKIRENEELHIKMFEMTRQHKDAQDATAQEMHKLVQQAKAHDDIVTGLKKSQTLIVERLTEEKALAQNTNESLRRENERQSSECAQTKRSLAETEARLKRQAEQQTTAVLERTKFDDLQLPHLAALNIAPYDRELVGAVRQACTSLVPLVREHAIVFGELCQQLDKRVLLFPSDGQHASFPVTFAALNCSRAVARRTTVLSLLDAALSTLQQALDAILTPSDSLGGPNRASTSVTLAEAARQVSVAIHGLATLVGNVARHFSAVLVEETKLFDPTFVASSPSLATSTMSASGVVSLGARNRHLTTSLRQLTALYEKIASYVSLYARCLDPFFGQPSTSSSHEGTASSVTTTTTAAKPASNAQQRPSTTIGNQAFAVGQLIETMQQIQQQFKVITTQYISKASLEQGSAAAAFVEVGSASSDSLKQLKLLNDGITSSLTGLVNCSGKFASLLAEKNVVLSLDTHSTSSRAPPPPLLPGAPTQVASLSFLSPASLALATPASSASCTTTTPLSSALLSSFEQRSRAYMQTLLAQPEADSVPYPLAIANKRIVDISASSKDALVLQVSNAQERTMQLEQDKEQFMLDAQLTASALAQEKERTRQLEEMVQSLQAELLRQQLNPNKPQANNEAPTTVLVTAALASQGAVLSTSSSMTSSSQHDSSSVVPAAFDGDDFGEMISAVPSRLQTARAGDRGSVLSESLDLTPNMSDDNLARQASQVSARSSAVSPTPGHAANDTRTRVRRVVFATVDASGNKKASEKLSFTADDAAREDLIKKHFATRIAQLTEQLQLADSKAAAFHIECRALARRIDVGEAEKASIQQELEAANGAVNRLKDELATTERSYAQQIQLMTEHIATMNEQLSQKDDQIEAYRRRQQQALQQQQQQQRRK